MGRSKITSTDRGLLARIRAASMGDRGLAVKVGVLADKGAEPKRGGETDEPLTVMDVATQHEFGAPAAGIPQRSFVRATVDEHEDYLLEQCKEAAVRVLTEKQTPKQALGELGAEVVGLIQERMAAGISPPNDPTTVARKGSATPLIDTGQLRSSISWEVIEK